MKGNVCFMNLEICEKNLESRESYLIATRDILFDCQKKYSDYKYEQYLTLQDMKFKERFYLIVGVVIGLLLWALVKRVNLQKLCIIRSFLEKYFNKDKSKKDNFSRKCARFEKETKNLEEEIKNLASSSKRLLLQKEINIVLLEKEIKHLADQLSIKDKNIAYWKDQLSIKDKSIAYWTDQRKKFLNRYINTDAILNITKLNLKKAERMSQGREKKLTLYKKRIEEQTDKIKEFFYIESDYIERISTLEELWKFWFNKCFEENPNILEKYKKFAPLPPLEDQLD